MSIKFITLCINDVDFYFYIYREREEANRSCDFFSILFLKTGVRDSSYETFLEDLQVKDGDNDDCRYAVYDYDYVQEAQGTEASYRYTHTIQYKVEPVFNKLGGFERKDYVQNRCLLSSTVPVYMPLFPTFTYQLYSLQVQTVPDVVVSGLCQDQEEDDLFLFLRHAQEGLRRGAQGGQAMLAIINHLPWHLGDCRRVHTCNMFSHSQVIQSNGPDELEQNYIEGILKSTDRK